VPAPQVGAGAMIAEQQAQISALSSVITTAFAADVADGKLSTEAISALAETLFRVPVDKRPEISQKEFRTPEKLYSWAIANANIIFPYVTLESAVRNMKHSLYAPRSWGVIGDKFRLPKSESTADSAAWELLRNIFLANLGRDKVEIDGDIDETVPDLSNEVCTKEPLIETVLIRLLELSKNPLSATIRRTDLNRPENVVKNAVDFIILEHIYQKGEDYTNLSISGFSASAGRRSRRVESKSAGNKLSYTTVFVGYRLADMLCKYEFKKTSKSPEGEPFCQAILGYLRKIVPENLENYQIPKSFFETPSSQLRSLIREGPLIQTKRGAKHNLYVPLSFVKSSECVSYPEVSRKKIIDIGTKVVKTLDEVNKQTLSRANELIPTLRQYLHFSYALSDKCRKEWRMNQRIPDIGKLEKLLVTGFPNISSKKDGEYEYSPSDVEEAVQQRGSFGDKLPFVEAFTDPSEKAIAKASIDEIINKRRTRRPLGR
jgi:hypothetical protein